MFTLARIFEVKHFDSPAESRTTIREGMQVNIDPGSALPPSRPKEFDETNKLSSNKTGTTKLPVCHLTPAHMQYKRKQGQRFNCDQRWTPSHRCLNGGLMVLAVDDDDEQALEDDDEIQEEDKVIYGDISCLHLLTGRDTPHSLRLKGRKGNQNFTVLVDNGSTHNFIQPSLAKQLKLDVQSTTSFRVSIGNSDTLVCQNKCVGVSIELQGTKFLVDLFILPIQGPDVILGIQWLQELGRVTNDDAESQMVFTWK